MTKTELKQLRKLKYELVLHNLVISICSHGSKKKTKAYLLVFGLIK